MLLKLFGLIKDKDFSVTTNTFGYNFTSFTKGPSLNSVVVAL